MNKELEQIAEKHFPTKQYCKDWRDAIIGAMKEALAPVESENEILRNAQKACADCDAPTMERIKQLERERDELRNVLTRLFEIVRPTTHHSMVELAISSALQDRNRLQFRITALESQLATAREATLREAAQAAWDARLKINWGKCKETFAFRNGQQSGCSMAQVAIESLITTPASNGAEGDGECECLWRKRMNAERKLWKFCPYCGKTISALAEVRGLE